MQTFTEIKEINDLNLSDKKEKFKYSVFLTQAGYVSIISNSIGIVELFLPEENFDSAVNKIKKKYPQSIEKEDDKLLNQLKEKILCYFKEETVDFYNIPIDLSKCKDLTIKVFEIIRTIPFGQTRTYRWVAEQLNNIKITRVVGKILSSNKIPIIIPCHRIIKSDGEIGGFSYGVEWKIRLLKIEKVLK